MAAADPDNIGHRPGARAAASGRLLSEAELAALGTFHSGMAEVSVQEWAILLRCQGASEVAADELVASLLDWFPAPLSLGEITTPIDRLIGAGFLVATERGQAFRTTRLGEAVLEQVHPPMIRGAMWVLGRKEEEGDRDDDR